LQTRFTPGETFGPWHITPIPLGTPCLELVKVDIPELEEKRQKPGLEWPRTMNDFPGRLDRPAWAPPQLNPFKNPERAPIALQMTGGTGRTFN
jgi:hypothetical protein